MNCSQLRAATTKIPASGSSIANADRLAALSRTGLLDAPVTEAFERLTRLAAETILAPMAFVTLVAEDRQFFLSSFGIPQPWAARRQTPLSYSFCQHVVSTRESWVVPDARSDPRLLGNLAIQELGIIAYAGLPLTLPNHQTIGTLCVADSKPRAWNDLELRILHDLSGAVVSEIQLRLTTQASDELLQLVLHDLKNPLSTIILSGQLLRRAAGKQGTGVVAASIARVEYAADRMAKIMEDLTLVNLMEAEGFSLEIDSLPIHALLRRAGDLLAPIASKAEVALIFDHPVSEWRVHCDVRRLTGALISAASALIALSAPPAKLVLQARREADRTLLSISSTTATANADQVQHFFERFWKGTPFPTKGLQLGLYVCREIVEQHGGQARAELSPHLGLMIRVELPDPLPEPSA